MKALYELFWKDEDGASRIIVVMAGLGLIVIILFAVLLIVDPPARDACRGRYYDYSQECLDQRMDNCLESERYTRNECIVLIGGDTP